MRETHIHIVGICGTFMGGIAVLAKQAGYRVTGCDVKVYPPMSTQLQAQGIEFIEGFGTEQIALQPDVFVVGNVVSRGNLLMEEILNRNLPYISGPQWLAQNILHDKWVLAVAGTHGKTTTASMLAWILECAGLNPGFLIGGVPQNFGLSARLTDAPFFVIEADEYDTAFFDKRSKFVHYHPRTVILNNLEFDHADIFADLAAIETQFHHLLRTVPGNGLVVSNGLDDSLRRVIERGCWAPVELFACVDGWDIDKDNLVKFRCAGQGELRWELMGEHNRLNALAAIAAARHVGVSAAHSLAALSDFKNVKRRMEVRGVVNNVTVYDDFAHHPTAIATTVRGLRTKVGDARILAVVEPRSNTMKLGVMKDALPGSLQGADKIFCYDLDLGWDASAVLAPLGDKVTVGNMLSELVAAIAAAARPGDSILVMSNGGFGGIHDQLLKRLAR
ncbi:MAG: UDP-N-acetylmuramate:L-alanyl-gamma-D-glutamyl-meso-diaminopimelate ligase [Candidatus Nitrotoga sp.]|nr:UDP-N-acetylmuramate:L-alanyl-gamma-D-glutamyl-meso-diaminopimelate ligase [Candidatus Nitrotoga sp.]MBP0116928.1 UDP-N-acetylmuramate:L-alanyl-gamma-D-glutamyl-meso-diaminopimelate ligase [Candidatus Nitrotoga sp.]MBP0122690.1 UDP-N-acetylmuramate:L-alanyl-gamma-D-glutamyl-meso-diaminopimelate ligase [Candidatus Nitrotoga sp.]MBP0126057.1 UDP-N-acetylmuramate:L-alanyl-gamma-D-glutamyl-meso-diaminopimelate ligase [Candidatus Nitrotoga sp.]